MINVCWVHEAGELHSWGFPLAVELQARGVEVQFATKLRFTQKRAEELGFDSVFIPSETYHDNRLTLGALTQLDRLYGPPGLSAIANSNAQFDWLGLPFAERIQIVARHYRFWERYLDAHHTDFVFFKTLGTVETRTLYNVARAREIPYFQFSIGAAPGTFTMNDVGETQCWRELLDALAAGSRELSSEEARVVWDVIERASGKIAQNTAPNTRWAPASPREWYQYAKAEAAATYRVLQGKLRWSRDPLRALQVYPLWKHDPIAVAGWKQICRLRREQLLWKHWISRSFTYDSPLPGQPFVYFPLFHYYETTTLATCPFWARNTLALVAHAADLLPEGFSLYVKEHPIYLGQRSIRELRALKRHPRIRVIDPTYPGRRLIQDSSAVVVVVGTSGWEAFLNRKPVVVLGSPFYAHSGLAYRARDMNELESSLWTALQAGDQIYEQRASEWLWFVWCVISTSAQGMLEPVQYPYLVPTDQRNLSLVAGSVANKVTRVLAARSPMGA